MFDVGERERVGEKKNLSELKRVEVFPLWAILKVCLRVCGRARLGVTHTHTHTPERQVNVSYIWSFWKASGSIFFFSPVSGSSPAIPPWQGKTAESPPIFEAKFLGVWHWWRVTGNSWENKGSNMDKKFSPIAGAWLVWGKSSLANWRMETNLPNFQFPLIRYHGC